ncbi:hypothetical protein A6V39_02745 [Candidatus Mycoplasma haematobovis]|uniref:DUF31 domain-containing protein n=1 Tax=Candidatus Mycoplasma haematobovis TaxID=432608 RepID=A0A1A9QCM5_9MOLU|nr:hypothetical protein [Candidatus Mycoplasma haematobovis]OAL10332.1 hypothetical protein A6V39_02745 [Candidatus Mycoplasma haematobovis]
MAGGSSGGIFVDSDGYAVGIINVTSENEYGTGGIKSWALPFRSEGNVEVEGKVTPRYNLILGGFEGQKRSYFSQVKQHILDKGGKRWLS